MKTLRWGAVLLPFVLVACGDDADTAEDGLDAVETPAAEGPAVDTGAVPAVIGDSAVPAPGVGGVVPSDAPTDDAEPGERPAGGPAGTTGRTGTRPAQPGPIETSDPTPPAEGDPTAVQILARASAAYANVRSMRAEFTQMSENPLLRRSTTSRGTIYQRRPDRFLMDFSEPEGDLIVSDGEDIWVYYPSVNPRQVIRAPLGEGGAGAVDLQAQFLGDPTQRFRSELLGRERVAGANAYVLMLRPIGDQGYRSLKVWIDPRDYLARRFEITENNNVVRRFDLSSLRTNAVFDDALFEFTPPEGTHVVARG